MASKTLNDYANILMGTQVVVENNEGKLFTGVLESITPELEVFLTFAQELPVSEDSKFALYEGNTMRRMKIKATRLTGEYHDKERERERAFRTDGEIAVNGGDLETDKEFQRWEGGDEEHSVDGFFGMNDKEMESRDGNKFKKRPKKNPGWSVDEMFEANKDKCVGESSFDENLTQYSNVEIGNRTKEQLQRAEELARQIEMNPTSRRNALLENDDEERDLDTVTEFKEEEEADKNRKQIEIDQKQQAASEACQTSPQVAKAEVSGENGKKEEQAKREEEAEEEGKQSTHQQSQAQQQQPEDKKSTFTFNPGATPFIPKQKEQPNSNIIQQPLPPPPPPPPPAPASSANNYISSSNLPSQFQIVHFPTVPMQANAQVQHGMPPPHQNLLYNNAAMLYPQQQQAMMPGAIPAFYAYPGNSAVGQQQGTVFIQPNPVLLQQQAMAQAQQQQQQFVPVTTGIVHHQQNHQQSRTGTPLNGAAMHQLAHQSLIDSTTGTPLIQQHQHQHPQTTTIFHNAIQSAQTGPAMPGVTNALPLMNIVPQVPPHAMMQAQAQAGPMYTQQSLPPQMANAGPYVPHHQQQQYSTQQQLPQPHPLSRSNSVQPPQQHFQPVNLQQHAAAVNHQTLGGMYGAAAHPYAQSLMQQQPQYQQMPFYVQPHTATMPPPSLTHAIPPPIAHGPINNNNMIGRPSQQHS